MVRIDKDGVPRVIGVLVGAARAGQKVFEIPIELGAGAPDGTLLKPNGVAGLNAGLAEAWDISYAIDASESES